MSTTTSADAVTIERLIAEADESLDRKDAAALAKQADVIRKITTLTAHHKNRLTAYYRFLSEDLAQKRPRNAAEQIISEPPARKPYSLPPVVQPPKPGRTSAVKIPQPVTIEETDTDDSNLVSEAIDTQELLSILIDDPNGKPKLVKALTPHCEAIAAMKEIDEKSLLELIRKIAVDSKGDEEEGNIDHYQVRLMLQLIALRRQLDDDLRDKMIATVDTIMYSDDADDE